MPATLAIPVGSGVVLVLVDRITSCRSSKSDSRIKRLADEALRRSSPPFGIHLGAGWPAVDSVGALAQGNNLDGGSTLRAVSGSSPSRWNEDGEGSGENSLQF